MATAGKFQEQLWDNLLLSMKYAKHIKSYAPKGRADPIRKLFPNEKGFTFWDYFYKSWEYNARLRLAYFLLNGHLAERPEDGGVDKEVRGWQRPAIMRRFGSH
jgi:exodeoxyribonuclease III